MSILMPTGSRLSSLAALFLISLPSSGAWADGKLTVVTTLTDLAAIARAVGGDRVEVTSIASGVQDPHFVDPKPSYVVKLRDAELFLVNGLELEVGWVRPLLDGARNPKINAGADGYVDCSAGIPVLEVPSGELSRAEGDVHPRGNPHYLADPLNGKIVAKTVAAALSRVDPTHAADYAAREKAFSRSIDGAMFGRELVEEVGGAKLDRLARSGELPAFLSERGLTPKLGGWLEKLEPMRGQKIVFFHRSFTYFNARFGIAVAGFVEQKAGIQPGPGHLAELVTRIRKESIRLVGTHAFYDAKIAALVSEKGGAKLVTFPLSVGGAKGADDYLKLFDVIAGLMSSAHP
ncbi:MAG: zinc ABC transporter substrate-binding protein [Deltaproteobacteria bacterium]|nr:zinc ABC transporter substrate-binding protein [Deltaproteobacteria bacterium]